MQDITNRDLKHGDLVCFSRASSSVQLDIGIVVGFTPKNVKVYCLYDTNKVDPNDLQSVIDKSKYWMVRLTSTVCKIGENGIDYIISDTIMNKLKNA